MGLTFQNPKKIRDNNMAVDLSPLCVFRLQLGDFGCFTNFEMLFVVSFLRAFSKLD